MHTAVKLSLLILLTVIGHSFSAIAQGDDPLRASIRKAGQVRAALASAPPYMVVSPSGEATGSSVDLQNMVLKAMGLPALAPVLTGWDAMIPGLQAHQFDYVGAGLSITEAGCKAVLFSVPYYVTQAGLYVLPGNPKRLTAVADVARRPEMKIAILPVASYQGYALKQRVRPEQIISVPDIQAGVATVIGGRADAFLIGQFTIPDPKQKGLELVVDEQSPVYGSGIAFRKEDVRFRDAFNEHLRLLLRDGAIQKLYEKYGIPNGDMEAQLLAKFTKASDIVPGCE